jgi:hypothetical protein
MRQAVWQVCGYVHLYILPLWMPKRAKKPAPAAWRFDKPATGRRSEWF